MPRTNLPLCLVALSLEVAAIVLGTRTEPIRAADQAKTEWEYKVIERIEAATPIDPKAGGSQVLDSSVLTSAPNKLGEDGWEVVGTFSRNSYAQYILKRDKR